MSVRTYFKKRNWTRKSITSFRKQLIHHLTPKEYAALPVTNDLDTFPVTPCNVPQLTCVSKARVKRLSQEIHQDIQSRTVLSTYIEETHRDSGYVVFKEQGCHPNVVLDVHRWSKKFPYFQVATMQLSPDGSQWLLAIDFVGSDTYHLFTKSLYAEDYRQIKLPSQHRLHPSEALSNERTSSPMTLWLDNTRILYVSINRHYNESGLYLYHLDTKKHRLLYKNKPGCFIHLQKVTSGLFVLMYSRNYHSDEVFVLDCETLQLHLLIPRQFSVNYPYLNHERGQWIVCKRDKQKDILATTSDFTRWNLHYQNKNPYEQIVSVFYEKESFVFLLQTLSGLCLYSLKCKQIRLLTKSFDDYEIRDMDKDVLVVYHHKYTCPKESIRVSLEHQTAICPAMKPRYHEETLWIHPHLRVTLLYKRKSTFSPCVLRGYGGYNDSNSIRESVFYYPLLERGFVVAIAHVRGGGEYGYRGYDQGRLSHKKNTFQDFIDTAHFLIDQKWTCRDKLAIWGRSFGGLLIAAVLNQEPDLCRVALMGVPFVTPLETLRNDHSPLGIATRSELGDIRDPKMKEYIRSYSPIEHVQKEGAYPHVFIYTNVNDTSVPYRGPLAYYNALKEADVYRTGQSNVTLYTDPRFGHTQGTLQKDKCDHYGILWAYLLKYLNL